MVVINENAPQVGTAVFMKGDVVGQVQGVPVWELTPPDAASMSVAPDGMSVVITWVKEGLADIKVSADADLGDGVSLVSAVEQLTFPASTVGATSATISFAPVV